MFPCGSVGTSVSAGSHEGPADANQRTSREDLSGSPVLLLVSRPLRTHWTEPSEPSPPVRTRSDNIRARSAAHCSGPPTNLLGKLFVSKESIQPSQARGSGPVTSQLAAEVGRRKKKSSGATKTRFAECYRVRAGEKGLDRPEMNEEKDRPSCRRERGGGGEGGRGDG